MTYPTCPECQLPRRPAHELAAALKAAAIPVRDAHEGLSRPHWYVNGSWALGRLDDARAALEAFEDSCACPPPAAPVHIEGEGYSIAGPTVPPPASVSVPPDAPETLRDAVPAHLAGLDASAATGAE